MTYRPMVATVSFSDLELSDTLTNNRTHFILEELKNKLVWDSIERTLLDHYTVGKTRKGSPAYSPLMLFKCQLLRRWFSISADRELQSLINDRMSFKRFLGMSVTDDSPGCSTISRFRKRVPRKVLSQLFNDIDRQLVHRKIRLRNGIASDPKLIRIKAPLTPLPNHPRRHNERLVETRIHL